MGKPKTTTNAFSVWMVGNLRGDGPGNGPGGIDPGCTGPGWIGAGGHGKGGSVINILD